MPSMDPIEHILDIKQTIGELKGQMEASESERHEGKRTQKEINQKLDTLTCRMAAMPDEEHKEHHDFMKQWIEREKRKQEAYDAIRDRILTGGAWALICGIGMLVWYGFKDLISKKIGG